MAVTQFPLANTPVHGFTYDQQAFPLQVECAMVGDPAIAAKGVTTGNGAYPIFMAYSWCAVTDVDFTVSTPGTGATSNLTCYHVSGNNAANLTGNVAVGNLITTGINVAGNVFTTGPLTYNSTTLAAVAGGIVLAPGDYLQFVLNGNTLAGMAATHYSFLANATFVV